MNFRISGNPNIDQFNTYSSQHTKTKFIDMKPNIKTCKTTKGRVDKCDTATNTTNPNCYDLSRVPSYCDRVLYYTQKQQQTFTPGVSYVIMTKPFNRSDHSAVVVRGCKLELGVYNPAFNSKNSTHTNSLYSYNSRTNNSRTNISSYDNLSEATQKIITNNGDDFYDRDGGSTLTKTTQRVAFNNRIAIVYKKNHRKYIKHGGKLLLFKE